MTSVASGGRSLAVVTGARSENVYELAKQFGEQGFDLLIAAEDEGIVRAAKGLRSLGVEVDSLQTDLATYEGVEQLFERVQRVGRPVEAIAINAGGDMASEFVEETDLKNRLDLISLNVTSSVHLAKRLAKNMAHGASGRIVFSSSVVATVPAGALGAFFGASRTFLQSLTFSLRQTFRAQLTNVRRTVVVRLARLIDGLIWPNAQHISLPARGPILKLD